MPTKDKQDPIAPATPAQPSDTRPSAPADAPAATDVAAQAARDMEIADLRREKEALRDRLDGADADELVMLRAEVDALRQAAVRAGVAWRHDFELSEGVRADLERTGYATDPATGAVLVRDESGTVTETSRTGKTRTLKTRVE